jgi:nitrile hydratase
MTFSVGDPVRTRIDNPDGHTRIPVYLRGRPGRIEAISGRFLFSDAEAKGIHGVREALYTVAFRATDLWGADADPTQTLAADLFESYLESAP